VARSNGGSYFYFRIGIDAHVDWQCLVYVLQNLNMDTKNKPVVTVLLKYRKRLV